MINGVTPTLISESYRLSHSGSHQGLVLALQSDFDSLRVKYPGVVLEISRAALVVLEIAKCHREQKIVLPISGVYNSRGLLDVTR